MSTQTNGYQQGFNDGRRSMFNEIVTTIAEERHEAGCRCAPCQVMRWSSRNTWAPWSRCSGLRGITT